MIQNRCAACGQPTDPPVIIEHTPPFDDIEEAFDIAIDADAALDLYNMRLGKATRKILEMEMEQCQQCPRRDSKRPPLRSGLLERVKSGVRLLSKLEWQAPIKTGNE